MTGLPSHLSNEARKPEETERAWPPQADEGAQRAAGERSPEMEQTLHRGDAPEPLAETVTQIDGGSTPHPPPSGPRSRRFR